MRRIRSAAALVLAAALLLSLSGCGVFDTKMARALQKMSKLHDLHYAFSAELELALERLPEPAQDEADGETAPQPEAPEETEPAMPAVLPLTGSLTGSGELFVDPLLAKMDTVLQIPGFESRKEIYLEKDGDVIFLYSLANGGSIWEKQGFALQETARVSALRPLIAGVESFAVTDEPEMQREGTTCYLGILEGAYLQSLLELFSVEDTLRGGLGLRLADDLFEEVADAPAYLWLDNATGMLVRLEVDATAVGDRMAAKQLRSFREASEIDTLGLEAHVTRLRLSVDLSQFDEAQSFTIPEEAKAPWGEKVMPWET
ncbi:MAG: hypothetical protein IJ594_00910 [Oscillospiraceae bacterium]|nr:hypothetical protein [Oscillospiraceae bacterium]